MMMTWNVWDIVLQYLIWKISTRSFPNWKNIKLKSEQWGGNPTVELTIDAEGGVKTTNVAPPDFKKFYGGADTTVAPAEGTNP